MNKDCCCSSSIIGSFSQYFKIFGVRKCWSIKPVVRQSSSQFPPFEFLARNFTRYVNEVLDIIYREECWRVVVTRDYQSVLVMRLNSFNLQVGHARMAQMRARINWQMPWNLTQLSHLEQLRLTQCRKNVKITSRVCATLTLIVHWRFT